MKTEKYAWDVKVDENNYNITLENNQVSINNGQAVNMNRLKRESVFPCTKYYIPLGDKEAVLNIGLSDRPVLTMDGRNCVTGEPFTLVKMPGWGWIFVVLHILNCIIWLFGILGMVIVVGVTKQTMEIACDGKKSTKERVVDSVKFWLRTTLVEVFVGGMLYGVLFLFLYFLSYM